MSEILGLIGIILIFVGFTLIILSAFITSKKSHKAESIGIFLIGPFPIVWGSNKKYLFFGIIFFIIVLILIFLLAVKPL
ncbi:MAG: TIGR00304 family membrane protein [Candidatus Odinarchaeia archaeon]